MLFGINENHCRFDSQLKIKSKKKRSICSTSSIPLSMSFTDSFERRTLAKIFQQIPTRIKILASLCQILDDHPLSQIKIEQIQQETSNCILWNENSSYPIAIDQNIYLNEFRQSLRRLVYEFLEFAHQILMIFDKNEQINFMIEKSMKFFIIFNDYRAKRPCAYNYFCQHYTLEDAMLTLYNIDKQQYHELRLIALHLRQFFLKLIMFISSKYSFLG